MNSQAHAALKKIQGGNYAHPTSGIEPIGYNYEDGSRLVREPGFGWKIGKCVPECSCIAGMEAYGNAAVGLP